MNHGTVRSAIVFSSIHPSIHPSTHSPIHLPTQPSTQPLSHSPTHSSTHPPSHSLNYRITRTSIHPSIQSISSSHLSFPTDTSIQVLMEAIHHHLFPALTFFHPSIHHFWPAVSSSQSSLSERNSLRTCFVSMVCMIFWCLFVGFCMLSCCRPPINHSVNHSIIFGHSTRQAINHLVE